MDMNCPQAPAQAKGSQDMQKDHRIATAGKANAQMYVTRAAGREKRGNPGREATSQAVP